VNAFDWSKLKAYYDFNSFYGSTVEGQTDDRNFLRINYLSKTKSIVNTQTAPLPYISASNGAWGTEATWVNGTLQNIPNSIGLDGSTMVDWNIVEIGHNITSGNKDIAVLGLISTGGKLTIADPLVTSPVELNDGQGLSVSHYLKLDGVIDLVGESQLVQYEGSTLDNDSGGYLDRDQQGTASSYNYNYWSSSVGPIAGANNADYTISGVLKDGTDSSDPKTITFSSSYTAADLVSPPSPRIISSYWLWKFYGADNDYNAWAKINETTPLKPGEGYTMKGTFRDAAITTNQNYKFRGKPYNGDITLLLDKSSGDVSRLIGNPYPSAIDADEFILDHIKTTETFIDSYGEEKTGRNTINVFSGALYFWHHFAGKSHFLAEYEGGYATYTLMGGTMAYATETLINNTGNPGNKIPERNIPVNQGFFVNTTLPVMDGITSTVEGGTITFKNSQRIFERERFTGLNDGSLFFKTASTSKATTTKENTDKRPKIWLQYSSPKGYFRQLLVGVAKNATNNFDIGYDAPIADLGKEDMFWTFNNANFVIQAVNNFDRNQELSFGLKLEVDGLATIKVDKIENVDDGTELYIKDNTTGETYQINNQPFEMNLVAGEYLDRFSLVFQPRLKTMEEISTIDNGIFVYMNNNISELQIKKIVDTEIKNIYLMNYLGQTVGNWKNNLSEREISIPIKITTGVYIVQINTKDGIINKKIVIN